MSRPKAELVQVIWACFQVHTKQTVLSAPRHERSPVGGMAVSLWVMAPVEAFESSDPICPKHRNCLSRLRAQLALACANARLIRFRAASRYTGPSRPAIAVARRIRRIVSRTGGTHRMADAEGPKTKALTKSQLVAHLSDKLQLPKTQTVAFFDELAALATSETATKGEFTIPNIGKLVRRESKARTGRNPATGAEIDIPAKTSVKFRVSKAVRDAVAPPKEK